MSGHYVRLTPYPQVGEEVCQTFPTNMFFDKCAQNFACSQVTFEKSPIHKNLHISSSEECVSARVDQLLVADQMLACQFAYTLHLCNLQCFKHLWKF